MLPRPASASEIREIRQEHTACFGTCPVYDVTLRRDGTAQYRGEAFLPVLGIYSATIDSATFARLAGYVVRHGFFKLESRYAVNATDQASVITTVLFGADSATIDCYGRAAPYDLRDIQHGIDSVASRLRWTSVP
jgi:hypothetical protein